MGEAKACGGMRPTPEAFEANYFEHARQLPTGEWAALCRMIFTTGLVVGIDLQEWVYRTRFCFEHYSDALASLNAWDGRGDPPGPWIKEKGRAGERSNPARFKGIPVVLENQ